MRDHPPISPLPAGTTRPFWSVMIPTREPHPDYLRRTLASVLEQDPGPEAMQIALVDDCSSRVDPRQSLRADARARVGWSRQARHVGIGRNWNTCIEQARGQWVHILHQDDLVLPGFYLRLRSGIDASPSAGAAVCRDVVIDADGRRVGGQRLLRPTPGIVEDWIEHVFVGLALRASALVVKRSTYEGLDGFRLDLQYALDWDMWKRIAAAVPLWYTPDELACYRRHADSASVGFQRRGANIAEIGRSIALSESLLPPELAAATSRRARQNYTRYATDLAWRALAQRDLQSALAQLCAARRLTSTLAVAQALGRLARARALSR
ncbi:MAG: glycosyltransferase [bacterium]